MTEKENVEVHTKEVGVKSGREQSKNKWTEDNEAGVQRARTLPSRGCQPASWGLPVPNSNSTPKPLLRTSVHDSQDYH